MIEAQAQQSSCANRYRVVYYDRAFLDAAHTEDRELRLIDDRHADQSTEDTRVCDRECAALHFIWFETLGSRSLAQVVHCSRDSEKRLFIGVSNHGNDQTPVQRNRDPRVHRSGKLHRAGDRDRQRRTFILGVGHGNGDLGNEA